MWKIASSYLPVPVLCVAEQHGFQTASQPYLRYMHVHVRVCMCVGVIALLLVINYMELELGIGWL